jgi:hypothetical protein
MFGLFGMLDMILTRINQSYFPVFSPIFIFNCDE